MAYIDLARGDTLYQEVLPVLVHKFDVDDNLVLHDCWDEATEEEKLAALEDASSEIDALEFRKPLPEDTPLEVEKACLGVALILLKTYYTRKLADPIAIQNIDIGASTYWNTVGDASERVGYKHDALTNKTEIRRTLIKYLKHLMQGNFRISSKRVS